MRKTFKRGYFKHGCKVSLREVRSGLVEEGKLTREWPESYWYIQIYCGHGYDHPGYRFFCEKCLMEQGYKW